MQKTQITQVEEGVVRIMLQVTLSYTHNFIPPQLLHGKAFGGLFCGKTISDTNYYSTVFLYVLKDVWRWSLKNDSLDSVDNMILG